MRIPIMKALAIGVALTSLVNLQSCSLNKVEGGEELVMTYQPWIWGSGGVDGQSVRAGSVWTIFSTNVEWYNIKPKQYTEPFVDLTASDNVAIDFNSYVTLQIQAGKTPQLHEKYGVHWYNNRVKEPYRTMVRNEGRSHSSIALRTDAKTINQSQDAVLLELQKYLDTQGIPVTASKVVIGKVVPPNEVLAEAERTAAQKQRGKTMDARTEAEIRRGLAETKSALADKAYAQEFNMTTEQFLRNKELDIIASKKNVSVVLGVTPFVQVK